MGDVKPPKRVTILSRNADGTLSVKGEAVAERSKKKGTKGLNLVERIVRTGASVGATAANSYLARHKNSNEKKKDGWLKDAPVNMVRSGLKGAKKIKVRSIF
jgi:hypothetical protein